MSGCDGFEDLIERRLAGEPLPDGARAHLAEHLAGCAPCGQLFGFHAWLEREGPAIEEPAPGELAAMRRGVLEEIRRDALPRIVARAATPEISGPSRQPLLRRGAARWALLAAAASALLTTGWLLGRASPSSASIEGLPPSAFGSTDALLNRLESAPYQVSNVSVAPAGNGSVSLTFDVSRRIQVQRPGDDPLVRQALLQSFREISPLGDRLRAVTVAGELLDPAIREAMIRVMRGDPSVAVRLRAAETLSRHPADPEVQQAMLEILASEESVAMRLLAVDYLGASQVSQERILEALKTTGNGDGNRAVLVRARERLGL